MALGPQTPVLICPIWGRFGFVDTPPQTGWNKLAMEEVADQPTLLDVDPEVLALALNQLSIREQCAAALTCKIFSIIMAECRLEETYLSSAVSSEVESMRAQLEPKLKSPPSMGVLFANTGRDRRKELTKLVRSLPPAMHLVGAEVDTLVGTMPDGNLSVQNGSGLALTLGAFPEAEVGSFTIERNNGEIEEQLHEQVSKRCTPTAARSAMLALNRAHAFDPHASIIANDAGSAQGGLEGRGSHGLRLGWWRTADAPQAATDQAPGGGHSGRHRDG